jgi:putative aldouronate transport system substrate-binding protein
MPRFRKSFSSLLVLALLFTTVACSSGGSSSDKGNSVDPSENAQSNEQSQNQTGEEKPAGPDHIKLYLTDLTAPIPAVPSMEIPTIKYMGEKTNVNFDVTFLAQDKFHEQLKLKFAAGDYPDVFMEYGLGNDLVSDAINNGLILELNDLIDKYGPNLKKQIPQEIWDSVTVNGKIMAIPEPQPGNAPAEKIFYVRKDWLDKLGLQPPKTSDEYLDMLRAFRDGDPNGNGEKDEIPYSMREKLSWADSIFGMFGINYDNTVYNGEVIPGFTHPNAKKALQVMRTMYEEKLLDSEFLTNTRTIWVQKIMSDRVGNWVHVAQDGWTWQNDIDHALPDKDPKPEIVAIPTPQGVGYDGPVGRVHMYALKTFFVLKNAEHPEAIIRWLDWLSTEEGQLFVQLGLEGVTYKKDGDNYVYDGEADKKEQTDYWRPVLFNIVNNNEKIIQAKLNNPEAFAKINNSFEVARKEGIPNPLSAMPSPKAFSDNPDLLASGSLWQTTASKIILGEAPLDSFDDFVKTWRSQGGEDAIKEMTEWYNTHKK